MFTFVCVVVLPTDAPCLVKLQGRYGPARLVAAQPSTARLREQQHPGRRDMRPHRARSRPAMQPANRVLRQYILRTFTCLALPQATADGLL